MWTSRQEIKPRDETARMALLGDLIATDSAKIIMLERDCVHRDPYRMLTMSLGAQPQLCATPCPHGGRHSSTSQQGNDMSKTEAHEQVLSFDALVIQIEAFSRELLSACIIASERAQQAGAPHGCGRPPGWCS